MSLLVKAKTTFLGLTDTPDSFSGETLKVLRVNAGEDALELVDVQDFPEIGNAALEFVIDEGGAVLSTGEKGHLRIPFGCTITRVSLLGDQSGSIKMDIWSDTYGNYPPTDGDSICGGNEPEISSGVKYQDSTLTDWTTSLSEGNVLAFNIDSCTAITRCTVVIKVEKT